LGNKQRCRVPLSWRLTRRASIPTVEGEDITVHIKDQNVFINDAQVVKADVDASNGVVHVVNAVLIPK
jgi:uncharacterized surface protein with fasciclin (FAS1) repeats